MPEQSFLDTGVVLAFAFTTDKHHKNCREYLESDDCGEFYISPRVRSEYHNKEPELADRYSDAVFKHVSDLKRSDHDGQLDPMDIKDIRENILHRKNPAYVFLYWFYRREVSKYLPMQELQERLRGIARGIDVNATKRREELETILQVWEREKEFRDVGEALANIHEQDRLICIDAHSLALNRDGDTELATTNPNDFVRKGHRELILKHTALSEVESLAA